MGGGGGHVEYSPAETERHVRGALALAEVIVDDPGKVVSACQAEGYAHIRATDVTRAYRTHSFKLSHDEHYLIVNQHRYPDAIRFQIHVHVPGRLERNSLVQLRERFGLDGDEGLWRDTLYVHWKRPGAGDVFFVDITVDSYSGSSPAVTRVMIETARLRG